MCIITHTLSHCIGEASISGNTADLNGLKSLGMLKMEQLLMARLILKQKEVWTGWGTVIPRCHKLGRNPKLAQLSLQLPSGHADPNLLRVETENKI